MGQVLLGDAWLVLLSDKCGVEYASIDLNITVEALPGTQR